MKKIIISALIVMSTFSGYSYTSDRSDSNMGAVLLGSGVAALTGAAAIGAVQDYLEDRKEWNRENTKGEERIAQCVPGTRHFNKHGRRAAAYACQEGSLGSVAAGGLSVAGLVAVGVTAWPAVAAGAGIAVVGLGISGIRAQKHAIKAHNEQMTREEASKKSWNPLKRWF